MCKKLRINNSQNVSEVEDVQQLEISKFQFIACSKQTPGGHSIPTRHLVVGKAVPSPLASGLAGRL